MKTATEGYVKISRLDHWGELGVPTGLCRADEAEFVLLKCKHGHHKVWLKRNDII